MQPSLLEVLLGAGTRLSKFAGTDPLLLMQFREIRHIYFTEALSFDVPITETISVSILGTF